MIELHNVTKRYGGTTAIRQMSLTVSEPGIYCLLGKNGAGKTTLMKLLAGFIDSSEGMIAVNGATVSRRRMPSSVHFIESTAVQFNMKLKDLLATASELSADFDRDFAMEMVARFGLDADRRFKHLSLGMKAMFNTILALASNSKVILLDEPTLGFDAIMRKQFNDLLLESYAAHPRIIIVSTHLIDEIERVAQKLIIINDGELLLQTDLDDIDEHAYSLSGSVKAVGRAIVGLKCIGTTTMGSVMAAYVYDERIEPPEGVTLERLSLEDFFINIVGGNK
ncbi:MAG: ABC transporter ATP-binding protein [Bifidobacteriaceae bacterium]|jgi:ABC-2 type transport system ATP-binding protein|nr:ABC transporter ATP-binding protein [Bifidobacteriaceae bacterium]MCI1915463.1 ABC transporter ATP-binding protein [Bifidobacteriaceae bacterium]